MPLVPAVCTQCGAPIEVDNAKEAGICPHCGTAFITEKAINNYITQHVSSTSVSQTIVKNIYGREKTEAEEYVARGLSFLGLGEYIKAAECFEKAVKSEPGNIENHILLYRALTFDFRLYYGGLTGPDCSCPISFRLSGQDEVSLDDVFGHIERLAKKADISALQKQYGHTFRADKAFWLESFRTAARLYDAQRNKRPDEILSLLQKNMSWPVKEFTLQAAYSVENLYACSDFTEEERAAFFEEYCRAFRDEKTDTLNALSDKLFPLRDGYRDLTIYGGAVFFAKDYHYKTQRVYKLRFAPENLPRNCYGYVECDARIAAEGAFDAANRALHAQKLTFEEGVTEIVNSSIGSPISFMQLELPDSLERIGTRALVAAKDEGNKGYIKFGKGLRRIEEEAFSQNLSEKVWLSCDLLLPEGLEFIGDRAFAGICCHIAVLPASLVQAGTYLFGGVSLIICFANANKLTKGWNYYTKEEPKFNFGYKDGKWDSVDLVYEHVPHMYNWFDVPGNVVFCEKICYRSLSGKDCEITAASSSEEKADFLPWLKQYCDFDETKTNFADSSAMKKLPPSKKKKGCYIATAVYGSYDCPQVWTLRRYRDFSLSRTAPGRLFVKLYYAASPALVKLFGKQRWFRSLWKKFLDRKVARLNARGFEDSPYRDN